MIIVETLTIFDDYLKKLNQINEPQAIEDRRRRFSTYPLKRFQ